MRRGILVVAAIACACTEPAVALHATYVADVQFTDGPIALLVHRREVLLVQAARTGGVVRVLAAGPQSGEALSPDTRAWRLGESVLIDSIAVVDSQHDGIDELLIHATTRPAQEELLMLLDPLREEAETLWRLRRPTDAVYEFNTHVVAAAGATEGMDAVVALVRLGWTEDGLSGLNAATYALTRASIDRFRSQPCESESCIAPWRVGATSDTRIAGSLRLAAARANTFVAYYATSRFTAAHAPNDWSLESMRCTTSSDGCACTEPRRVADLPILGGGVSGMECTDSGCRYVMALAIGSDTGRVWIIEPDDTARAVSAQPFVPPNLVVRTTRDGTVRIVAMLSDGGAREVRVSPRSSDARLVEVQFDENQVAGELIQTNLTRPESWILRVSRSGQARLYSVP